MKLCFIVLALACACCARAGEHGETEKSGADSLSDGAADSIQGRGLTLFGDGAGEAEAVPDESRASGEGSGIDFGPFFSSDIDLAGNRRWRALGPLIEKRTAPDGRVFWAVRPFFSRTEESVPDAVEQHAVWPVWTRRVAGSEEQWCFAGVAYWYDWDTGNKDSRNAFWVLPIYFQGRDARGEPYRAVFPLGGSIHDFLGQDEISFVLFPLYTYLRINEVETRGYPWPLVSRTRGGKVERLIVFPFYGRSQRAGQFDKYFVMWPFWSHANFGFEQDTGYGYIAFPFYGHAKLGEQESFFFLPPFFRFGKARDMSLTYCPWPLYQRTTGSEDKLYIWPLWGRKSRINRDTWFFLWPLFLGERHMEEQRIENSRFLFIPIVFHEARRQKSATNPNESRLVSRQLKIWPLASYWREEDNTLFRAPSLWPLKDYKAIERNYAPFWTLYSRSRIGPVVEDELLWGLFRYRREESGAMNLSVFPLFSISREEEGKAREWSFLKGLVGCEREGDERSLRLLYLFKLGI